MKLDLKNVTLVAADGFDPTRLIKPFEICINYCDFGDVMLFTNKPIESKEIHITNIGGLNNAEEYSYFIFKQLGKYISTDYCLIIQYDGYILNPKAWTSQYFEYDYIGASWRVGPESFVGNGGFSLRSKRLLKVLEKEEIRFGHPEDHYICRSGLFGNYEFLRSQGFRFAPIELADKFSIEGGSWNGQFGYHSNKITNISKWKFEDYVYG